MRSDLERLYRRTAYDIKLGLDTETALLDALGNPQSSMPFVHVAGTNGKGSVCAMLESVYRAAGYVTGLYTSPHLVEFNERIRVGGEQIADQELADVFRRVEQHDAELAGRPGGRAATFFEFTTAMAFEHFRRKEVEIVVLETGLGGRLDATNVVTPLVSLITRIDIEHTAYLGKTLEEIAAEKAGIVKPGRPVICGAMPDEARAVVWKAAREQKSPMVPLEEAVSVRRVSQSLKGQKIKIETADSSYGPLLLPMLGKYQLENVALALAAVEYLNGASSFACDAAAVKKGLESVRWPARCQVLSEDPLVILDVAHNPNAAHALADSLKEIAKGKGVGLVFSLLADKDCRGFLAALAPLVRKTWVVPIHNERAMPVPDLAACARNAGLDVKESSLPEALAESKSWAAENDGAVCIAGSLFLAGEVLANLLS